MWKGAIAGGTLLVQLFWLQVTQTPLKWLNQKENKEEGKDLLVYVIGKHRVQGSTGLRGPDFFDRMKKTG